MNILDHTGSASFSFTNSDSSGRYFDILIVKDAYSFDDDFQLQRRKEPELIVFADTYKADPASSSIQVPSDVVPYKPKGDVVLSGMTYAPGGEATDGWSFGVDVLGAINTDLTLYASGPRIWKKRLGGWSISDPTRISRLSVQYENAYGGAARGPDDKISVLETNPIGCGWFGPKKQFEPVRLMAPQILSELGDTDNRRAARPPAGLGAISPAWLPRRPLGGTYDETWQSKTAPHWPIDYDFAYHNAAPQALQGDGFFAGNETIILRNLRPEADVVEVALPGATYVARTWTDDGATDWRMNADTLYVDVEPQWPGACLVTLTWRIVFAPGSVSEVECFRTSPLEDLWQSARTAPHPHDVAEAA